MRPLDFTPLYRATVGFDQIADLMDRVLTTDTGSQSYPPFNIEKTSDNDYRITLAVAGFAEDELSVEVKENALHIEAKKADADENVKYLHRGIATRAFSRRFHLADHLRVTGASQANGLLHIDLMREVPEALKPRRIEIGTGPVVEAKAVETAEPY